MSHMPHLKPTPPGAGSAPDVATPSRPRGHGWVVFTALMLFLAGAFNVIDGLVALADSRFYVAGAVYVWSDVRTWGWIVLALGVVELLAGSAILRGRDWGRWFGIGVAGLKRDRASTSWSSTAWPPMAYKRRTSVIQRKAARWYSSKSGKARPNPIGSH